MKTEDKIILITDDTAAKEMTVTGWVSRNGRFFGKDEKMARYDGCTHRKCEECGKIITKSGYMLCQECQEKNTEKKYLAKPFKEWDNETPLCLHWDDKYFFDAEEIDDYLEENELHASDLQLVICEPNHFSEINIDNWIDTLPEDGDLPKELAEKLDEFNKYINKLPPCSWTAGKYRTKL